MWKFFLIFKMHGSAFLLWCSYLYLPRAVVGAVLALKKKRQCWGITVTSISTTPICSMAHTVGWVSTTIPVYGATGAGWRKAIKRWPTVNFRFVATKPTWGIHILGYDDLGNICGLASFTYDSAGALEWCTVKVSIFHEDLNCARVTDTITHEIGRCIGVFKHTTDGGLMDEKADGSSEITSSVTAMVGLLYTLAPGTGIRD